MSTSFLSSLLPSSPASTRAEALSNYGTIAQISTLAFLGGIISYRQLTLRSRTRPGKAASKQTTILGEPLPAALIVGLWLLALLALGVALPSIKALSNPSPEIGDYIYLTRLPVRLLAALLPMQVLLSNSSPVNILPHLTRLSRAQLIPFHRTLGWLAMVLFALHGSMYINFYNDKGILLHRVRDSDVQLGLALSASMSCLAVASRRVVRRKVGGKWVWAHVAATVGIGCLLWAHVTQTRFYVLQAGVLAVVGVLWRVGRSVFGS